MAPPVEEAQTKVMKVATTVVRRQSAKSEESKSTPPPAVEDDLHLTVLEESFRNAQSGYDARWLLIFTPCDFILIFACLFHCLLFWAQVGSFNWKS